MTSILVVADTEEQLTQYREKNCDLIPGLCQNTSRRLRGPTIVMELSTVERLESAVCGVRLDAVVNLSTADPGVLMDRVGHCFFSF